MKTKYNSKKVVVGGITYDSQVEYQYNVYLQEKLDRKEILDYELQPSYELIPKYEKYGKKFRSINYTPDYLIKHLDGSIELVDIKGFASQASELRRKLFDYMYPDIKLTWVSYVKKYGGWLEYEELKKKRKLNKKEK